MAADTKHPLAPILIVDDEEQALTSYALNLRFSGITNTILCSDSRTVPELLSTRPFSLVMLDLSMPHTSGEEILAHIREQGLDVPAIVLTGHNEVETAVRCMQAGSLDYLVKPVDRGRLLAAVTQALERRGQADRASLTAGGGALVAGAKPGAAVAAEEGAQLLTRSPAMREVLTQLAAVARSREPALIVGETGVGKELAARAIHQACAGDARHRPFIGCNVAGLDDVMLSDTLFGHKKGAYTGAQGGRSGLLEEAGDGTLFLDEIGDLSLTSQLKLLRCIQEREYYPLGSDAPRPMDCRLVAATNKTVAELLDPAVFRRDLFFRLRTHLIVLPPLRDRLEDLELLVPHFLEEAARETGQSVPEIPEALYAELRRYDFPGNVRELKSMLLHACTLHRGGGPLGLGPVVDWMQSVRQGLHQAASPLPPLPSLQRGPACVLPTLRQAEARVAEDVILQALKQAGGNQSKAAKLLGISRQALHKRLKTLGDVNPG
ncbi:sigma-54-dependent transcriptional regulator [Megalodesulfovibrio paquesii]